MLYATIIIIIIIINLEIIQPNKFNYVNSQTFSFQFFSKIGGKNSRNSLILKLIQKKISGVSNWRALIKFFSQHCEHMRYCSFSLSLCSFINDFFFHDYSNGQFLLSPFQVILIQVFNVRNYIIIKFILWQFLFI